MKIAITILSAILLSTSMIAQTETSPNDEGHGMGSEPFNYDKEPYNVVEEMPRFPGCEDQGLDNADYITCSNTELVKYIYASLNYPQEARKKGIQGKVILQFVVHKSGKLKDIKVVRSLDGGCSEAAEEVMLKMQKEITWIPGKQLGKTVDVQYTLPIDFRL